MKQENEEFFRRIDDLSERCERSCTVTCSGFLTPQEQFILRTYRPAAEVQILLSGGDDSCERRAAFFLPYYMDAADFDSAEYIHVVRVQAHFGTPTHRDYMGAVLGLGIRREWIGDFRVIDDAAYIFCLPSVEGLLLDELDKVGRIGVKTAAVPLADVPPAQRKVRTVKFTVKSLRLDAVLGEMFGISRTAAADLIRAGAAEVNYEQCLKTDRPIDTGDIITLRGHGKGQLTGLGGKSRKDRQFAEAEIFM